MNPLIPIESFLAEASATVQATGTPQTQRLPLHECTGRHLAESLTCPHAIPGFDASAMDGYAVASTDATFAAAPPWTLPVQGTSAAGHPFEGALAAGRCVRILTGAELPAGADTVIMQEDVEHDGDAICFSERPRTGAFVRPAGHDAAAGTRLLNAGVRLTPSRIGIAAAAGFTHLQVRRRCRVSVFSTGDELVPAGSPLGRGCIHDSNGPALAAAAVAAGAEVVRTGRLPDDAQALASSLAQAATDSDFIVSSGGVSVGDADLIVTTVRELGEISHWRLAIKPGKPFAFGRIGAARFCGLPGNPASALVTFEVLVLPLMRAWLGAPAQDAEAVAALAVAVEPNRNRVEFVRGLLEPGPQGPVVRPTGNQDSGRLSSFAAANCLIRIDAGSQPLPVGTPVRIRPLTVI